MQIMIPPQVPFGAQWGGLIVGNGESPSYHLILLPGKAYRTGWDASVAWAADRGGELPTLREHMLLDANLGEEFDAGYPYWAREEASQTHAYCHWYGRGGSDYIRKGLEMRVRAILRAPLS